jgi:hypothetical protein
MQNEQAINMFAEQEHKSEAEQLDYMPPSRRAPADRVPEGAVWRSDPIWMRESHQKYGLASRSPLSRPGCRTDWAPPPFARPRGLCDSRCCDDDGGAGMAT